MSQTPTYAQQEWAATLEQARTIDAANKKIALDNFNAWADAHIPHEGAADYLKSMVSLHYGAVETDALLTDIGCYAEA